MDTADTEVLVHIAAPARAADDKKYRALAAAAPPTTSASPRLQQPEAWSVPGSQSSWRPPPSVIEDSMPDNDCALAQYCTPTRILSHYTSAVDSSPLSQRERGQEAPSASSQLQDEGSSQASVPDFGIQHEAAHEEIAPAIPPSPTRQHKGQGAVPGSPLAVRGETEITSPRPSQPAEPPSSFRAESEPPLRKRPRTARDPEPGKSLARSASDMGPRRRAKARAVTLDQWENTGLEILSPPPTTGLRELRAEDMVTDVLASLARELGLEKRFRPASQARELRPFERGYWLVDCSAWPPDLKRFAWEFLADYLRQGAAGWGTSCRRDREFSRIRLYCWGCVVGHMYLVLYLMSKRRVLYSGASWVDGEGKAVVVMEPRPAPA
ncbi:hypothetical protein VTH06DRAFT_2626 [Thermothelomyces fergusii]